MSDGPTVNAWPPTEVAGVTTPQQRFAGGWGAPANSGGGEGSGERINPEFSSDKAPDTENRYLAIRWQDNRSSAWSKEHLVSLGKIGPAITTIKIASLGIYKSRQWEIILQAAFPLVIVTVEEEAEQLGS